MTSWEQCLVVVDMQPCFKASKDPVTIRAVKREIRKAIKNNVLIIFLEYASFGRTWSHIQALLENSTRARYVFVEKGRNDGSTQVKTALKNFSVSPKQIKVCGVNRNACVMDTVDGLSRKYPSADIIIVDDAVNEIGQCNSGYGSVEWNNNVRIVNRRKY